jgi:hypothetical protein
MTGLAHVYVADRPDGAIKIGHSKSPLNRIKQIGFDRDEQVRLLLTSLPMANAPAVEVQAHWLLRGVHLGGEWFNTTHEVAIETISKAIEMVSAGEPPPQRINCATPFGQTKDVRIQIVMAPSEVEALDEWRAKNKVWSRSDAIRQAVNAMVSAPAKPPSSKKP